MKGFLDIVRRIITLGGTVSAMVFLPALILVAIFDIISRRFLQFSSTPLQELEWHFFFGCVTFGVGYTYLKDRHVRVDIVRERLSPRIRTWIERILLVAFFLPLCIVLVWFGARMAWLAFMQDEGSRAALGLGARWVPKSALPLGALLLFLAGFYRLIRPMTTDDGKR